MSVIAVWSHIETQIARILAQVLKADIRTAMSMYEAVKSAPAREAAFLAAIYTALDKDSADLVRAVMTASEPNREVRHSFAHHIWGASKGIDGLLLVDPSYQIAGPIFSKVSNDQSPGMEDLRQSMIAEKYIENRDGILVWTKPDFEEALNEAFRVMNNFGSLWAYLYKPDEYGSMRQKLLDQPDIARWFVKASDEKKHSIRLRRRSRKRRKRL